MSEKRLPWGEVFRDDEGRPARIRLEQLGARNFVLESSLRFRPPFPLDGIPDAALHLAPADLIPPSAAPGSPATTDLASVPGPFRWFLSTYGVHTPAALLHDRLVGGARVEGVADTDADRLFRQMLEAVGVPFLRRWLMWSAVAFGTRWRAKGRARFLVSLWAVLALTGMGTFLWAVSTGEWIVAALAAVAPVPAAALWGTQYGAGLIGAFCAIWLAPPTILGMLGYAVYWCIEKIIAVLIHAFREDPRQGRSPVPFREF